MLVNKKPGGGQIFRQSLTLGNEWLMRSEALWKRPKWDVSLLGYCRHLIDTLQKAGYGRGFLEVGPAPAGVKRIVLLFCIWKVKLLTQPNSPQAPKPSLPLFLVKNLSNSKRVFIKKTNGHDGQRAPLDHHHQLHLTLNSLFVPTQNSLFERNRTEWQFWTGAIITPSAVVGCRHSLTESRLSVCPSLWMTVTAQIQSPDANPTRKIREPLESEATAEGSR